MTRRLLTVAAISLALTGLAALFITGTFVLAIEGEA